MAVLDHTSYENNDAVSLRELGHKDPRHTAALMTCTLDCIKLLCPKGTIAYMSHNGQCAMEVSDLESVLGNPWWAFWPEENQDIVRGAFEAARSGKTANFIADCPTAKGNMARWDVTVQGVFDADGELEEVIAVSRKTADAPQGLTTL